MRFFKPFELPLPPTFNDLTVSICDFGAKENEKVTESIKKAIEYVNENGGGRIVIPSGKWITGAIHLKSNVNLHLEEGAYVEFSTDFEDYLPAVYGILNGARLFSASHFLYALRCENIAITGSGTFDGRGDAWWYMKDLEGGLYDLARCAKEGVPVEKRVYDKKEDGVRPRFLQFVECENVLIEGVTFKDSPSWTVHPAWCKNITVRDIKIINPLDAPNTDGINLESCKRGLVERCEVSGGDDMVCLKAGKDEDAWEVGIPCEDIEVRYCHSKCSKGGLTIGSEMSACVRNAYIHDCTFGRISNGIRIKSMKGRRGVVENIDYENLTLDIGVDHAISITMKYNGEPLDDQSKPLENMPVIRNISVENLVCKNSNKGIFIEGIKGYEMENFYLKNIEVTSANPIHIEGAKNVNFENLTLTLGSEQEKFPRNRFRGKSPLK